MKARTALAVAVIGLSPLASAQTRVQAAHDESASALRCLLDHDAKACRYEFVGSASLAARAWLLWGPDQDFELGALKSATYVGTQPATAFTTKYLNGRTADVYDVKFRHQEKTFYIVPPEADGSIHFLLIRSGAPNDERREGTVGSRIQ